MESFVGFEDATVTDVAQFLTNGGIPSATVECLRGELTHALHCKFVFVRPLILQRTKCPDDLVEDIAEFRELLPQAGLRMKVKTLVRKVRSMLE